VRFCYIRNSFCTGFAASFWASWAGLHFLSVFFLYYIHAFSTALHEIGKVTMDDLLENVPHLVPREEVLGDWSKSDELTRELWREVCGEGSLPC
jgi:hypothetical protein